MDKVTYRDPRSGLLVDTQRPEYPRQQHSRVQRDAHSSGSRDGSRGLWDKGERLPTTTTAEDRNEFSLPPIRDLLGMSGLGSSGWTSDRQPRAQAGWPESSKLAQDLGQGLGGDNIGHGSGLSSRSLPPITYTTSRPSGAASQTFAQPYAFPHTIETNSSHANFDPHEHRHSSISTTSNSSIHSASTLSSYSESTASGPAASSYNSNSISFKSSAHQATHASHLLTLQRSFPVDIPVDMTPRYTTQPPQSPLSTGSADASPVTAPSTISDAWSQSDSHYTHSGSSIPSATFPQDRYMCPSCGKAFSRPSSLRIHSHSHTGEKPFHCPQRGCGKAFSVRSNMKRHERGCHAERKAGETGKTNTCREILPAAG